MMFAGMNDAQRRAARKRQRRFHSRMRAFVEEVALQATRECSALVIRNRHMLDDARAKGAVARQAIADLLDEALRKGVLP